MGESSRIQVRLLIGLAFVCAACSSNTVSVMAPGMEAPPDGGFPDVPCDPSLPPFAVGGDGIGLTTADTTGKIKVRIDDAPKPPQKDYNTWRIAIEDVSGQPMPSAAINWACAWMAVHGHGSNPQAINNLGGGLFELSKQNLSMYGPWEVKLWIDPTGGGSMYSPQTGAKVLGGNNCDPSNGTTGAANVDIKFCVPEGGS